MDSETQKQLNEKVNEFVNRWFITGVQIQAKWKFIAHDEMIKTIQKAYYQGMQDQNEKNTPKTS